MNHEVRIGMSVYWVSTWPENDGFCWSARGGALSGWTKGTRFEVLRKVREELKGLESALRSPQATEKDK